MGIEKIFELVYPNVKTDLERFLVNVGLENVIPYLEYVYWIFLAMLVWVISALTRALNKIVQKIRVNRVVHGLTEDYSEKEIYFATSSYITTRSQTNDPASFLEPKEALNKKAGSKNLLKELLKEFDKRNSSKNFYLVLGDSGMGKTTFLINLYIRYKKKIFPFDKKDIHLVPLSNSEYKERIERISIHSKGSILLLDAFDEDVTAWDNPEENLIKLIKEVSRFSFVVLTCRGQFFSSKIDKVSRLGIFENTANKESYKIHKTYLSPLDDASVNIYLFKKYFDAPLKFWKAKKIVRRCPNLIVRPMLLNNIQFLLNEKSSYYFSAEIYLALILSWIRREKKFIDEVAIMSFSMALAVNIYENRNQRKGLYISEDDLNRISEGTHFLTENIILKSRTLLNRTGNRYKFSHKSIFEYFLAASKFEQIDLEIIHRYDLDNPFYLEGLSDAHRFFDELFILKITVPYLKKYTKNPYTPKQLSQIKSLNLSDSKITSLSIIKVLTQLESLDLRRTVIRDLKPLYSLSNLKQLYLADTFYDPIRNYFDSIKELNELQQALPNLKIVY